MSSIFDSAVGAVINWLARLGMTRRTEDRDWQNAARQICDELERLDLDLTGLIDHGVTPVIMVEGFLVTSAWDEYGPVLGRAVPPDGDDFFFGLSRVMNATKHKIRPLITSVPPGTPLDPRFLQALSECRADARRARDCMVEVPEASKASPQLATG